MVGVISTLKSSQALGAVSKRLTLMVAQSTRSSNPTTTSLGLTNEQHTAVFNGSTTADHELRQVGYEFGVGKHGTN